LNGGPFGFVSNALTAEPPSRLLSYQWQLRYAILLWQKSLFFFFFFFQRMVKLQQVKDFRPVVVVNMAAVLSAEKLKYLSAELSAD